jgi:hypothetical protein
MFHPLGCQGNPLLRLLFMREANANYRAAVIQRGG